MFTSHRLRKITELMNANATELVKKVQRDFVEKKKHVNLKVATKNFIFKNINL